MVSVIRPLLLAGDCRSMPLRDASVDSVVTDPPYGLSSEPDAAEVLGHWLDGKAYQHNGAGFMGKTWDSFVPGPEYWRECLRVLKPGGHLLAFSSTRTWDLLSIAIRLAGFECRDTIRILSWVHGQGWPKGGTIDKAIDRAAGATQDVASEQRTGWAGTLGSGKTYSGVREDIRRITEPATDAAKQWAGWSPALKPAHEVILVFRKPFRGSLASNVVEHGTGCFNVRGCEVGTSKRVRDGGTGSWRNGSPGIRCGPNTGRWPTNLVLIHHPDCGDVCHGDCPVKLMDAQSGKLHVAGNVDGIIRRSGKNRNVYSPRRACVGMAYRGFTLFPAISL